jgi:hypothetical protein
VPKLIRFNLNRLAIVSTLMIPVLAGTSMLSVREHLELMFANSVKFDLTFPCWYVRSTGAIRLGL